MTDCPRKYNILFLGPPGSGKGTYSESMAYKLCLKHIATGDILRERAEKGDELGKEITNRIDNGQLVSDDLIIGIIHDIMSGEDMDKGFTLDGFPRTLPQAKMLDDLLKSLGWELDYIFYVWAEKDKIIERIVDRVQCENCGVVYNMKDNPPKDDSICDHCGTRMSHRPDDNRKTVLYRFDIYDRNTAPVVEHYSGHPGFHKIYTGGPVGAAEIEMMSIIREAIR